MKISIIIYCLLFTCYLTEAYASAPEHFRTVIHSDKLVVKEKENTAIFTGHVVSKQKDSTLKADKMMVFYHSNTGSNKHTSSIHRIEVYDHVEIITPKERATSNWGYYEGEIFYLLGNVKMYNGNNVMTGEKFIHNNKTGKSSLVGNNQKSSNKTITKPKLILQPSENAS